MINKLASKNLESSSNYEQTNKMGKCSNLTTYILNIYRLNITTKRWRTPICPTSRHKKLPWHITRIIAKVHVIVPAKWHHNPSAKGGHWPIPLPKAVISLPFCPKAVIGLSFRGGQWCPLWWVLELPGWGPPRATHPTEVVMVSHIRHPHGFILHNAAGTHHGHSRFACCFHLQRFWGFLVSSYQRWVSPQTGHHFSEAWRWCHFLCSFQRPQLAMWAPALYFHSADAPPPFNV